MRLVDFGHLGDGNLHYNVQAPPGVAAQAFMDSHEHAVNHLVYDAVAAEGGSISAEHGVGALKRDELAQRKSPVALRADARHQASAGPAQPPEPGPRAVA